MKIKDPEKPETVTVGQQRETLILCQRSSECIETAFPLAFMCDRHSGCPREKGRRSRYRDVPATPRRPKTSQSGKVHCARSALARKTGGLGTSQRTIQTQENLSLGACTSWCRGCKTDVSPSQATERPNPSTGLQRWSWGRHSRARSRSDTRLSPPLPLGFVLKAPGWGRLQGRQRFPLLRAQR